MLLKNNNYFCLGRGLVRIAGPDRAEFLQGLISNDITLLTRENALYACLLTPQGKFLHDFFITTDGDAFVIDCEPGDRRDDLIARLSTYKLRRKVEISPVDDLHILIGLDAPPADIQTYTDPRHHDMGWRAIVPAGTAAGGNSTFDDWDYRRISLGIPDGSRDAEIGVSTLEELNIPRLNGISFTKGCYVGQELTARMQNRGLGKRHLKTVKLSDIPDGAELRSSCRDIGLALIREA